MTCRSFARFFAPSLGIVLLAWAVVPRLARSPDATKALASAAARLRIRPLGRYVGPDKVRFDPIPGRADLLRGSDGSVILFSPVGTLWYYPESVDGLLDYGRVVVAGVLVRGTTDLYDLQMCAPVSLGGRYDYTPVPFVTPAPLDELLLPDPAQRIPAQRPPLGTIPPSSGDVPLPRSDGGLSPRNGQYPLPGGAYDPNLGKDIDPSGLALPGPSSPPLPGDLYPGGASGPGPNLPWPPRPPVPMPLCPVRVKVPR